MKITILIHCDIAVSGVATSEKVTLKVGIDLDGTVVRIDGTIYQSTILNAISEKGISLDYKSNDRFDNVSIVLGTLFFWYLLVLNFPLFINNLLRKV